MPKKIPKIKLAAISIIVQIILLFLLRYPLTYGRVGFDILSISISNISLIEMQNCHEKKTEINPSISLI